MRISSLVAGAQTVVSILLIGLATLSVVILRETDEGTRRLSEDLLVRLGAAHDLERALLEHEAASPGTVDRLAAQRRFADVLTELRRHRLFSKDGPLLESLQRASGRYFQEGITLQEVRDLTGELIARSRQAFVESIKSAEHRANASAGIIAAATGGAFFVLLLLRGGLVRNLVHPLREMADVAEALLAGRVMRRVSERELSGTVGTLAQALNRLADQLQELQLSQPADLLLARAALELLLDEGGRAGGVLDLQGRLVAANGALREQLLRSRLSSAQLLGLEIQPSGATSREEITDGQVQRGYLVRLTGRELPPAA